MRWGLIPFWAKDDSIGYKMINARAETVATKPAFREALKKRRCLIPADAFYEWAKNGMTKDPVLLRHGRRLDLRLCRTLGAVEEPRGATDRDLLHHHHDTDPLCADVHDRMPAILPDEAYDLWLDPGFQKTDAVCYPLKPFNPVLMRRHEVSSRVNLVKNDDAACAEPVGSMGAASACRTYSLGPTPEPFKTGCGLVSSKD
jgi:putative SOS response-associated peptidase YedK